MSTSNSKQPPSFDPDRGDSYVAWKDRVAVWKLYTKDPPEKQGPAVYLALEGDALKPVRALKLDELGAADGYDRIMEALDNVFLEDDTTQAFYAFKDFVDFRRESGQTFSKFIIEYESRYREVEKYNIQLDDKVQAYFMLAAANLTEEYERQVRTAATLTSKSMKETLQKVFGDTGRVNENSAKPAIPVKNEECLFVRGSGRGRGAFRGNSRGSRGGSRGYKGGGGSGAKHTRDGNPSYSGGSQMRCFECQSVKHLSYDCPYRKSDAALSCSVCQSNRHTSETCPDNRVEEANLTVHVTLFTGEATAEQYALLCKSLSHGILDSGCTKTVAGKAWVAEFMETLTEEQKATVQRSERQSKTLYKFGDGKESKSCREIRLPLSLWGTERFVSVDVIENDIPLLISRPLMTELKLTIDTEKHEVSVDGKRRPLVINSSGHYLLPVSLFANTQASVVLHTTAVPSLSTAEKRKKALKLHRQFAHASKERLLKLIKESGCADAEFLKLVEDTVDNCEFCRKYQVKKPKPIVSLPKSQTFNGCVLMDLKEVEKGKKFILHLIDCGTRYTAASLIHSKKKEVVVAAVCKTWIAYFGAPKKMHSDCGGEFCNEAMSELHDKFGIETSTTPGEAPWANGIVERHNKVLFEGMQKTLQDVHCSEETALAWAVSAANSLQNRNGFAPNQLVLGKNVVLPSVLSSELPALEEKTSSDLVRENLDALHASRKNFIKAENSQLIKRALKQNVRTYSEVQYNQGDKVYYKRRLDKRWKGPATVLGKHSNFVLIRHGAAYYRCHPCQLVPVHPPQKVALKSKCLSKRTGSANSHDKSVKADICNESESSDPESSNENQSDRESSDEETNENCAATENCGEERDVTGDNEDEGSGRENDEKVVGSDRHGNEEEAVEDADIAEKDGIFQNDDDQERLEHVD